MYAEHPSQEPIKAGQGPVRGGHHIWGPVRYAPCTSLSNVTMQDHWMCCVYVADTWCAQPDIWIEISRPSVDMGTCTLRCRVDMGLFYEWAVILQFFNNPNNGLIHIRYLDTHLMNILTVFNVRHNPRWEIRQHGMHCCSCHITIHIGFTQVKTLHIATTSFSVKVQTSLCVVAYSKCISHAQHNHTPPMFLGNSRAHR